MKNKNLMIAGIIIVVILVSTLLLIPIFHPNVNSNQKCHDKCLKEGWQDGKCDWPKLMNENDWNIVMKEEIEKYNATFPYTKIENRGSCVEAFLGVQSNHCGNEGQCNCYCFDYEER